jgi:hypothetical protein
MSSPTPTVDIEITVPGATADEIARGAAVARKVFEDAGVTPLEAAAAAFKQEAPTTDPDNYPALSAREIIAAYAWSEAYGRAVATCCDGWASIPEGADLGLVYDRDAYKAWAIEQSRRGSTDAAVLRAIARAR